MLKAVFFDMDDTLVLTSEADTKACAAVGKLAHKLQPKLDLRKFLADWHVEFVAFPWDPTTQVPVAQWRAGHWAVALAQQGIEDGNMAVTLQECFDATRMECFRFEPGVKEMVTAMRAQGLARVIITNGHPQIQRTKLEACGAAELFDGVLVGGEEVLAGRADKPHPGIFLAACTIAGCKPHEAVHIGDSLSTDIAGGNNAGLKATIWVNRWGQPLPEAAAKPTHIVKHVTELAGLVPQLSGGQLEIP